MLNHRKKPPQPSASAASSAASGFSRLVSGLRHEGGGSSLVVQTGFPTSLADLVVKNRDRLKKPSRRKKRSSDLDSSTVDVSAPSLTSDSGPSRPSREDRRCRRLHPVVTETSAPRGADRPHRLAPAAAAPTKKTDFGFLLGLFLVNLFVLAVPTTGRRKLAAGITLSAFGLWVLETIGVRVFGFLQSSDNATRSLELTSGGMRLERRALVSQISEIGNERLVSPIREVGNENGSLSYSIVASERSKSSSDLTEGSERSMTSPNLIGTSEMSKSCPDLLMRSNQRSVDSIDLNEKIKVSPKRRDFGALAKVCVSRAVGSSNNSKAKKLFGKFFHKKFRRKTNGNDANVVALDLSSREIFNSITEHEEETMEDDEITENNVEDVISFIVSDCVNNCDVENMDVISFIASDSISTCDVKNMDVVQQRVPGAKYISSQNLACFAFILVGLLGGKTLALFLTVFCFLFRKSTESLWKKKMDSVVDKL